MKVKIKDDREPTRKIRMYPQDIYRELFNLTPVEMEVFRGLVSGDGDIGGRMASSHPDAKPPVPAAKKRVLEKLAAEFIKADMRYESLNDFP